MPVLSTNRFPPSYREKSASAWSADIELIISGFPLLYQAIAVTHEPVRHPCQAHGPDEKGGRQFWRVGYAVREVRPPLDTHNRGPVRGQDAGKPPEGPADTGPHSRVASPLGKVGVHQLPGRNALQGACQRQPNPLTDRDQSLTPPREPANASQPSINDLSSAYWAQSER